MFNLLKEPLLHFLLIGVALFGLFEMVADDDAANDRKIIDVNRDTLLSFLQYRSRVFEPQLAVARLEAMSDAELDRLVQEYVREEALHREALALGMEKNDYMIRRRLVQSIEFITTGFASAGIEISEDDLAEYYRANQQNYFVSPVVTFTHVFYSTESHGRERALALAREKLAELNAREVPFVDAPQHGDRFLYGLNYVEREPSFVASHFGSPMATAVFALERDSATWRGPIESQYGFHLVLLAEKTEGRIPELKEIEDMVRYDAERDATNEQKDQAIRAIVDAYRVRRNLVRDSGTAG